MDKNYSSIRLEVTSQCNINCLYCHNSDYTNKIDDMSSEDIIKLIKNLKKKYPIKKILLTGGEPLLNKEIVSIVEEITKLGIKSDMVTNGKNLTKDLAQQLIESGLKRFRLSIDGFEEHQEYRKGSSYLDLWDMAEWLSDRKDVDVCVHTVCSPHNVKTLLKIYKKILEINVNRWRIFDIGYKGGVVSNKAKMEFDEYYSCYFDKSKEIINDYVSNNLLEKIDIEINGIFRTEILKFKLSDHNVADISILKKERILKSPCDYISHQMTIRSNGITTFCQYFHNKIFDFPKHDFDVEVAVQSQRNVIENSTIMRKINDCVDCKYMQICNSGCRARAEVLTGNIYGADPVQCHMVPRMINEIVPLFSLETQQIFSNYIDTNGQEPRYTKKDLEVFLKEGEYLF